MCGQPGHKLHRTAVCIFYQAAASQWQRPLYLMCMGLLECMLVGVDAAVWKLDRRLWAPWAEDSGEALQ